MALYGGAVTYLLFIWSKFEVYYRLKVDIGHIYSHKHARVCDFGVSTSLQY